METRAWLEARGYRGIPMRRTHRGHLHVDGRLAGAPVLILIDTGAGSTVVDTGFARANGLNVKRTKSKAVGAEGGGLVLHKARNAVLSLDGCSVALEELYTMDLAPLAAALAAKGVDPPQVVLGADVLRPCGAIIDYAADLLFLKPPAPETDEPRDAAVTSPPPPQP
jgi:hypothetical protein